MHCATSNRTTKQASLAGLRVKPVRLERAVRPLAAGAPSRRFRQCRRVFHCGAVNLAVVEVVAEVEHMDPSQATSRTCGMKAGTQHEGAMRAQVNAAIMGRASVGTEEWQSQSPGGGVGKAVSSFARANPSIERTATSALRALASAAHVER